MDKTFDGTKKFPIIAIIRPINLNSICKLFHKQKSTEGRRASQPRDFDPRGHAVCKERLPASLQFCKDIARGLLFQDQNPG